MPDHLLRVVLCSTPRLASTSRADSIPSLSRRSCSVTHCGMNDSVCTQCIGVACGEVEKTLRAGCFLTPECSDTEGFTAFSMSRHHATCCCCCSSLWLAALLRRLSERWFKHVIVGDPGLCCISSWQSTSSPPSSGLMIFGTLLLYTVCVHFSMSCV